MENKINNTVTLQAKDGHRINVYCWDDVKSPKAVVQIFHGMAEHALRYERFAKVLNSHGIVAFADDHRGHGITGTTNGKLGSIGKDGFNKIVEDENMITNMIKEKYPDIPVFVFAHSFGSFIGQEYITRYSKNIDGIILCGSSAQKGMKIIAAKVLASIYQFIFGPDREAKLLQNLSFGSYNRRVPPGDNTNWLSRDPDEVMKYNDDPHCGFICSADFYYSLTNGFMGLYKPEKLNSISKDLPICIIAGSEDPVGEYGKNVIKLYDIYKNLNINDVEIKLYEGARHELLNETNRDEVTQDILDWLNARIC
ncbi:MAG: alpha/beta hydrolase [Clostridiaceae bacterium]|mgnify:CR=1 FL=1|nr:alpha/beta hydrolase [Clostridiaceae bacterium]